MTRPTLTELLIDIYSSLYGARTWTRLVVTGIIVNN